MNGNGGEKPLFLLSGKWQAKYKKKYIGLYDTAEQAAEAIKEYKKER